MKNTRIVAGCEAGDCMLWCSMNVQDLNAARGPARASATTAGTGSKVVAHGAVGGAASKGLGGSFRDGFLGRPPDEEAYPLEVPKRLFGYLRPTYMWPVLRLALGRVVTFQLDGQQVYNQPL